MKYSLVAIALFLTVLTVPVAAQKADELRQKYGAPDAQSRYIVRPGVGMTVEFSKSGQAAKVIIKSLDSDEEANQKPPLLMSLASVEEILNEVIPVTKRGKSQQNFQFASSCLGFTVNDYEKVTISQSTRCENEGGGIYFASVQFK